MNDQDMLDMKPWYRGFKGTIEDGVSKGVYERKGNKVEVTELPVGYWTEDFKVHIENYMDKNPGVLRDYESHYTEKDVRFVLQFYSKEVCDEYMVFDIEKKATKFEIEFKNAQQEPLSTSNMHLYTQNGNIKKYKDVKHSESDRSDE